MGFALLAAAALSGCAVGSTTPATNVTDTGATLNGSVVSFQDGDVSYWFAYGKTAGYGSETQHRTIAISDRDGHPVSESVGGLSAGTPYHYKFCAQYPGRGTSCGNDESFTTQGSVTQLSIAPQPALYPDFAPAVSDYVTRCGSDPVRMTVAAPPGTSIAIDGQPAQTGSFTQNVQLAAGQRFDFSTTTGGQTSTFHVRCLPDDFPSWTFSRSGASSLDYALVTPSLYLVPNRYVAFFDTNGVPVWWFKATGTPVDAKLLSDNTVAVGVYPSGPYEIRRLDGTLVRTVSTVGTVTDFHDFQQLANGDYLVASYKPRDHVDLSPYGGPNDAPVVDAQIQEIAPTGSLVWSWNSKDHIALSETGRWWPAVLDLGAPYDPVHINAIEPDGNSLLISFRHLDAVYRIDRTDGHVEWKLGGTTTPQSLTVSGDDQATTLGGQHDARRLADGTVSIHDNGTGLNRAPRVLRFQIDPVQKTATRVEQLSDPEITASQCCGSSRKLDSGGWLVGWGGQPIVAEYASNGSRIFKLTFSTYFSYRAFPVPHGRLSANSVGQGMDSMFPR